LLGNTGLSGSSQDHEVEQFCSRVAGEWLLPDNELAAFETGHDGPTEGRIREFARARNLSSTLVAYRLLLAGGIGREAYATLAAAFRTHWRRSRKEARRERKASGGFVPWYTVRRHRLGNALVSFGRRMVDSGALSTTKAARILDVKPLQVQKLLSA